MVQFQHMFDYTIGRHEMFVLQHNHTNHQVYGKYITWNSDYINNQSCQNESDVVIIQRVPCNTMFQNVYMSWLNYKIVENSVFQYI